MGPYFASGDARSHHQGSTFKSPPCSTYNSCTNKAGRYRSKDADNFVPSGMGGGRALKAKQTQTEARQLLFTTGSLITVHSCGNGFKSYSGGTWDNGCPPPRANHATTAIGYGPGYIWVINSWKRSWGVDGKFKGADCSFEAILMTKGDPSSYTVPTSRGSK